MVRPTRSLVVTILDIVLTPAGAMCSSTHHACTFSEHSGHCLPRGTIRLSKGWARSQITETNRSPGRGFPGSDAGLIGGTGRRDECHGIERESGNIAAILPHPGARRCAVLSHPLC